MPHRTPAASRGSPPTRPRELAIVVGWLAATMFAFGWHGPRAWSASDVPAVVASFEPASGLALSRWLAAHRRATEGRAPALTLVHLRNPDCRCNAGADPQVASLRRQYAARGVDVVTLPVDRHAARAPATATPAAALLDADGTLLYLGPVDDAAFCAGGATPVQRALDGALAGAPATARPMLATGCFCT